jgi:hypothetical protein
VLAGYDLGDGSDVGVERDNAVLAARAMVGRLAVPVPGSVTIQEISIPGDPPVPARMYTLDADHHRLLLRRTSRVDVWTRRAAGLMGWTR